MSDTSDPTAPTSASAPPPYSAPQSDAVPAAPAAPAYVAPAPTGELGKIRGTGACILLTIVTLGIYSLYWFYKAHAEMKRHSGEGIGGPLALVISILDGIVTPFLTSSEVGRLYQRQGKPAPVTAATGLWYLLLGWFLLIGAIVWFVKTNGALNEYWRSQGQTD